MTYNDVRSQFRFLNFFQVVEISSSIDTLFKEDHKYHYLTDEEKNVLRKLRNEIATKVLYDNKLL